VIRGFSLEERATMKTITLTPLREHDPYDRLDAIIGEFRKLNREAAQIIDRQLDFLAEPPPEVYQ
jgi:hypothetical protein